MASFIGIDLSKETFHAFLLGDRADAKKVFPNTSKGFEQLTTWLKNHQAAKVHVCMEATGSSDSRAVGPAFARNPCAAIANAVFRPPQENPSAAVGVRTIVRRGRRYGLDRSSHRHARRTDRAG
jgi:transposase